MLPGERNVGGLPCSAVLECLSEYVDGGLPPQLQERVDAHLAACDWCTRFGGEFVRVIERLRHELERPEPLAVDMAARLRTRLGLDGTG
ncbi:MAG: anti-sigma factor [Vicinamibacterales bacterium]